MCVRVRVRVRYMHYACVRVITPYSPPFRFFVDPPLSTPPPVFFSLVRELPILASAISMDEETLDVLLNRQDEHLD